MPHELKLSNGSVALVDNDMAYLAQHTWHLANGYARRQEWADRKFLRNVYLHREVLKGVSRVDHKNGDRLDCRRANLRPASARVNARNRDGVGGLRKEPWGWEVRLGAKHLGTFPTYEAARNARFMAEIENWGVQPRRRKLYVDAGLMAD